MMKRDLPELLAAMSARIDQLQAENDALRAQLGANDPLTLEELRGMDGEPVWVTPGGFWALVHIAPVGVLLLENNGELARADAWIERMGPIYRRKPGEV